MHSAEVAVARAQAAADGKREVEKEVAEIKKYKDFRERNEEERDLIIQAAKACMFDPKTNELLPSDQQDRPNFARCMTVAAQLTAQIKPLTTDPDKPVQSQTVNIDFSKFSDEELKKLEPAFTVIESVIGKPSGTEKGVGPKASN